MRILIIEDQEKLALSIKKGLEHHGYAVDALYDGGQGLNRILTSNQDYDLVILDIMLPTMDGITICAEVRKKHINIPILMLTAKDTLDSKVLGLNTGSDDYMVKPFAFEELVARIGALLRRPAPALSSVVTSGDITLDTISRKVTKKNKEIILTVKEFAILEQFMRSPNQVLTRENILSHVWDFAFEGFSNVVDAHIKNLRRKLQNKNEKLFETVHGVGYRFKE